MKRVLFICALLLGSSQLFAQASPAALLRVRLNNGAPIMVTVDGRHFDQRGSVITIGGLPPGRHRIAVYKMGGHRGYGNGRPRLIYEGAVRTEPGTFTTCLVDAWRNDMAVRVHDMDREYNGNQDWYNQQDDYNDIYGPDKNGPVAGNNNGAPNDNRPPSDREPDNIYGNAPNPNESNRNDDNRNGYNNDNRGGAYNNDGSRGGYNNNNMPLAGMSSSDLSDLQQRVADRMTDTDKEKLLQTALKGKVYSSADIATILGWLSFDSTRLEFAKWAYKHVADQQNYYKTEDALSFSSSKTELDNFINGSH